MALSFDNSLIYKVQQANDIVDVISEHLKLDKKGKEYVGICPFHEDHRPSLYVSPAKNIFKCFACGVGGDVIKFIQMRENKSFAEAVRSLAKRASIVIDEAKFQSNKVAAQQDISEELLLKVNVWAARFFRDNLFSDVLGEDAREYLSGRNINADSIRRWGLGFAANDWGNLLKSAKKEGFTEKTLVAAGLITQRQGQSGFYDKFRNRLMFPILDTASNVIGFGGRTLGNDPAKYMNSPATAVFDKSNCVYGLNLARHNIVSTSTVIVVEGYTDVIMCHQFGCNNVVATLGTSFTEGHARLLRRFASNIVLVFDSDIAGAEAANRALEVCLSQKVDIKIASVPQGKDPCEYLLVAGANAFRSVVDNAVDVMEYKWNRLKEGLENTTNLADRKSAVEQYIDSVSVGINSGNIDPISAGLIISKISRITGIEANRLRHILRKKVSRIASGQGYAIEDQKVVSVNLNSSLTAKAQREILEVLLAKPELYDNVKENIKAQVFDIPIFRDIFTAFVEAVILGYDGALARTIANLESSDISNTVVELENKGKSKANFEKRMSESLEALIEHSSNNMTDILELEDEDEKLRKQIEIAKKTNLRKIGLVNI